MNVAELLVDPAGVPRARAMLQRAEWAGRAFARYDKPAVDAIVRAAAAAGAAKAREYADWAVRETGFGVAEHKVLKNIACSTGIVEYYAGHDYVTPRVDAKAKIVEVPRPAGVVLALTPSTNPVATVYFKCLLALMTRNVVVVSPHPLAKEVCADAARTLGAAAVAAGAPDGVIQVVDEPSVPLIDALMTDDRTSVIVATGGVPVVRAAYSSGTPAIGVGPGNVPVLVDATADLAKAARRIVDSKSFDNSVLCTNESVLIVVEQAAAALLRQLKQAGAYLLEPDERDRVSKLLFPGGRFDIRFVGKDASWIAAEAGLRVPNRTRVLLAPFDLVVPEEPLAHEKLCPVLGLVRVPSARRGIEAARAVLRLSGRGHSAAIHSTDPQADHGVRGRGRGAAGRRQRGQQPGQRGPGDQPGADDDDRHRVLRPVLGGGEPAPQPPGAVDAAGLQPRPGRAVRRLRRAGPFNALARAGPVPPYPVASNQRGEGADHRAVAGGGGRAASPDRSEPDGFMSDAATLREEIRRLILEELSQLAGG